MNRIIFEISRKTKKFFFETISLEKLTRKSFKKQDTQRKAQLEKIYDHENKGNERFIL